MNYFFLDGQIIDLASEINFDSSNASRGDDQIILNFQQSTCDVHCSNNLNVSRGDICNISLLFLDGSTHHDPSWRPPQQPPQWPQHQSPQLPPQWSLQQPPQWPSQEPPQGPSQWPLQWAAQQPPQQQL